VSTLVGLLAASRDATHPLPLTHNQYTVLLC